MLIEYGDGFDYAGTEFRSWRTDVGFESVEVLALGDSASAAIAYKYPVAERDHQTLPECRDTSGPVRSRAGQPPATSCADYRNPLLDCWTRGVYLRGAVSPL